MPLSRILSPQACIVSLMVSFPGPYGTTTAPAQTHIRYNNQGLECSDTLLKHVTVLHSGGGGWGGEVTALGAWKKNLRLPRGAYSLTWSRGWA